MRKKINRILKSCNVRRDLVQGCKISKQYRRYTGSTTEMNITRIFKLTMDVTRTPTTNQLIDLVWYLEKLTKAAIMSINCTNLRVKVTYKYRKFNQCFRITH